MFMTPRPLHGHGCRARLRRRMAGAASGGDAVAMRPPRTAPVGTAGVRRAHRRYSLHLSLDSWPRQEAPGRQTGTERHGRLVPPRGDAAERMPAAAMFENVPTFGSSLAGKLLGSHLRRIGYRKSNTGPLVQVPFGLRLLRQAEIEGDLPKRGQAFKRKEARSSRVPEQESEFRSRSEVVATHRPWCRVTSGHLNPHTSKVETASFERASAVRIGRLLFRSARRTFRFLQRGRWAVGEDSV